MCTAECKCNDPSALPDALAISYAIAIPRQLYHCEELFVRRIECAQLVRLCYAFSHASTLICSHSRSCICLHYTRNKRRKRFVSHL